MLDIVMVAHHRDYSRLAYRGIKVDGAATRETILGSLPSAIDKVGTPGKAVVSLEGGSHSDFESVQAYLESQNLDWRIVHHEEVTSYREAVLRGMEKCESAFVAVIPAWVEVKDPMWVHWMMWPMSKDPTALLCGTWSEQGPAKDMPPHVVGNRSWPGGKFFVARRSQTYDHLQLCQEDHFEDELAKGINANGWRIWAHPGVRFTTHPHEEYARKTARQEAR